jgi:Tfp pilus assembly protein PilP
MKRTITMSMACLVGVMMVSMVVFAQESNPKPVRFVISADALGRLQKENLPEDVLKKLNDLKDQAYAAESDVTAALEQAIGKDATVQYQFPILNAIYQYPFEGGREPFAPLIEEPSVPVPTVAAGQPCPSPLGDFEVAQFKVIGIVLGEPGDRARVIAPDGQSYTIMIGTCIGKFNGKVTALAENCLTIKETKDFQKGQEMTTTEVESVLCINPVDDKKK